MYSYIYEFNLWNYSLVDTISPGSARKRAGEMQLNCSLRQLYRTWIEPASRDVSNLVRYAFCRRKLQKEVSEHPKRTVHSCIRYYGIRPCRMQGCTPPAGHGGELRAGAPRDLRVIITPRDRDYMYRYRILV